MSDKTHADRSMGRRPFTAEIVGGRVECGSVRDSWTFEEAKSPKLNDRNGCGVVDKI